VDGGIADGVVLCRGRARPGVVNEETRWARENEREFARQIRGGAEEGGVCPGKKSIQSDRDNVFV